MRNGKGALSIRIPLMSSGARKLALMQQNHLKVTMLL
jgi:hypothetical protein